MNKQEVIEKIQAFTGWDFFKARSLYARIAPLREFPEEAVIVAVSDAYCRGFNHAQNYHVRPDEDVAEPELHDIIVNLKRLCEGKHIVDANHVVKSITHTKGNVPILIKGRRYRLSGGSITNFSLKDDVFSLQFTNRNLSDEEVLKSYNQWQKDCDAIDKQNKGGCPTCGGSGRILDSEHPNNTFEGKLLTVRCPDCDGTGERRKGERRKGEQRGKGKWIAIYPSRNLGKSYFREIWDELHKGRRSGKERRGEKS